MFAGVLSCLLFMQKNRPKDLERLFARSVLYD